MLIPVYESPLHLCWPLGHCPVHNLTRLALCSEPRTGARLASDLRPVHVERGPYSFLGNDQLSHGTTHGLSVEERSVLFFFCGPKVIQARGQTVIQARGLKAVQVRVQNVIQSSGHKVIQTRGQKVLKT